MAIPVILIVDDEPQVLNAVERDLRSHFRADYRIVKAASGADALDAARELKRRNTPLALFLVDQRMPVMSGTEFLANARELHPEAKRVLLTAYADTSAAISAINEVGLDHYLMKPWDPPEDNLYPILDDLLSDWSANVLVPYDGIRIAGTLWSRRSHDAKDFLARNRIPYQWLDIETDAEARKLVEEAVGDDRRLPVAFFPDGTVLIEPDTRALAEKAGLKTQATQPFYDVIIVGAGPAGLGAGVYAATEGLRTVMVEREATGGQAGTSSRIENYLGFPNGISGADLARRATAQAERFGAEILTAQEVMSVRAEGPYRLVTLGDGTELSAHALIIATGVSVRQLDVPGVSEVTGAGVYYGAATTEAVNYKGRDVLVVGGANSAGQGAMFLSRYAKRVVMLVRGSTIEQGMSQYLVEQIAATENIEVVLDAEVAEVHGAGRLESVTYRNVEGGATSSIEASAMFVFIGAAPYTELVAGLVERNEAGFILTGRDVMPGGKRPKGWARDPYSLETSVQGIFAVGDVRQGVMRRVASAVGDGSTAIRFVHQYLQTV